MSHKKWQRFLIWNINTETEWNMKCSLLKTHTLHLHFRLSCTRRRQPVKGWKMSYKLNIPTDSNVSVIDEPTSRLFILVIKHSLVSKQIKNTFCSLQNDHFFVGSSNRILVRLQPELEPEMPLLRSGKSSFRRRRRSELRSVQKLRRTRQLCLSEKYCLLWV